MRPFAVAGMQIPIAADRSNVETMLSRLDLLMLRFPWTDMAVFSELAAFGPLTRFAEPEENAALGAFRSAARRHRIWLVPGSMYIVRPDGKVTNRAHVIDPGGQIVARYDKMFPFLPYENGVEAGEGFCIFDVPDIGRFGLSICYDMWFPETTRQLTSLGAEVLLHPVMTGTTDRRAEIAMAQATAAQFQCAVIDVNGLGAGGCGRSLVVDGSASILHRSGEIEDLFPVMIDFDAIRYQRRDGLRGLGQVLKSFRDSRVEFPVYEAGGRVTPELRQLGPLQMPKRHRDA